MTGWHPSFHLGRKKSKPTPAKPVNILPEDVVRAIFLKWEIECRTMPDRFKPREEMVLQSADEVAEKNTKCFLRYAEDMGINHP